MIEVQWEDFGPIPMVVFVSTYTVGTIQLPGDIWSGLKGWNCPCAPLRVEPYIGQTHDWPAAGGLLSLYVCTHLTLG